MTEVPRELPLPGAVAGAARAAHPDAYWRSLYYFNIYRLTLSVMLTVLVAVWGSTLQFGSYDRTLFLATGACYIAFSIACFTLIRIRWRLNLQISVQVAFDIAFIVLMMYASNGITSGLGLLLFTTLAASGLVSRGRLTLFHAALASIGVLIEHTYEVLNLDAGTSQYVQAGLLSVGYFATAWLAHALAQRAVASEQLAAQREIDLANMAQVNQLVIQDMQDGVLVVDGKGRIRQSNASAERMLDAVRGKRGAALADCAPALAGHFARWRADATGHEVSADHALNRVVNARFVQLAEDRDAGAVIFLEDLTRIQAEARQMKLAALGRLTANIAHEIRNPLGAISHAAELLQEEPANNDTTRRLLAIVHDNTQRLDRMVNDVLRLNRGERAHRERFNVVDYLKSFVEQFCQIEKIPPELFTIEVSASPYVLFDRSHLNQVMWNLSRNALRHCSRRPGSIRIVVDASDDASTVVLDVIDDGPGVAPAVRGQLFEPFFTTAAGGTGLGLYIAREVCEANGASLDHVDTVQGGRFSIVCRAG